MPGPLFSASRASRRLRWPPEPSPAASLGDVGSGCRPRLAPALPAAPRLPPVAPAPRTATRPLERAVDAHTAGRGALSVDASASLLGGGPVPRRGGAAEYGSVAQRVATDEARSLLEGEAPRMFRSTCRRGPSNSGDCMALRHFASRDASKIMTCFIGSAVSCGTCCDKLAAIKEYGGVI